MNERERIIHLWFDMWLKQQDLGIDSIFTEDVIYTESWSPKYESRKTVKHWFDEWNTRGKVLVWDIKQFFHKENQTIVANLLKQINVTQEEKATEGDLCNGLTFVITGDVYEYKNRNQLKAYIESQGGKVTGSVSKSTSYLINNDLQSASSKNQKANQLGIKIISEKDFIDKFTQVK